MGLADVNAAEDSKPWRLEETTSSMNGQDILESEEEPGHSDAETGERAANSTEVADGAIISMLSTQSDTKTRKKRKKRNRKRGGAGGHGPGNQLQVDTAPLDIDADAARIRIARNKHMRFISSYHVRVRLKLRHYSEYIMQPGPVAAASHRNSRLSTSPQLRSLCICD